MKSPMQNNKEHVTGYWRKESTTNPAIWPLNGSIPMLTVIKSCLTLQLLRNTVARKPEVAMRFDWFPAPNVPGRERVMTLANEDTLLRTKLLPTQMFPCLPARATFVADTNFVSRTPKCFWFCSEKLCVRNKLFPSLRSPRNMATMCPQQCVLVYQGLNIRSFLWQNKHLFSLVFR